MMTSKKWYKSKILWLNAAFAGLTAVEAGLHMLQTTLGASSYLIVAGVVAAGNMVLRTMTNQGIEK